MRSCALNYLHIIKRPGQAHPARSPSINTQSEILIFYLDPPFFSGKDQQSKTRDGTRHFSFSDRWPHLREYADFMGLRIEALRPLLKETGSIIVHCDSSAN
jgi:site-specific DNA-methyltransferase (adenine-specific)